MSSESSTHPAAISIRDVGKCYHLYERPQDRLRQALLRWRGHTYYREFWALRNVSFDVYKGECLGIVGRNGSGKSTLLQIMAGTLAPTEGQVQVSGRLTALLELGGSFNPEFTGRENVYLSGAVMGVSKAEMDRRFDDITSFAEIGQFVDQPVKTYSSGMFVRLAFAVQVLLDPEILIVDEALAVGDVAFQFKCLSRMRRLRDAGLTVILVTHDIQTVRSICDRVVWLSEGKVLADGSPNDVTSRYVEHLFGASLAESRQGLAASIAPAPPEGNALRSSKESVPAARSEVQAGIVRWGSGEVVIDSFNLSGQSHGHQQVLEHGGEIEVQVRIRATRDMLSTGLGVGFGLRDRKGLDIIAYSTCDHGEPLGSLHAGDCVELFFRFENILTPGDYSLVLAVESARGPLRHYHDFVENAILFKVVAPTNIWGVVLPDITHRINVVSGESQPKLGAVPTCS